MKFNKNFDEVFLKKEQEIQKIKEKNKRIRKIIEDLNLPDNEVYEPELGPIEKPEMMLTTADDEASWTSSSNSLETELPLMLDSIKFILKMCHTCVGY